MLFRKDLKTNERREKSEKENGSLLDLSSRQDEKEGECYNSHQTMKKRKFTSLEKKEENVESLMYYSENCKEKKAGHLLVVL